MRVVRVDWLGAGLSNILAGRGDSRYRFPLLLCFLLFPSLSLFLALLLPLRVDWRVEKAAATFEAVELDWERHQSVIPVETKTKERVLALLYTISSSRS